MLHGSILDVDGWGELRVNVFYGDSNSYLNTTITNEATPQTDISM